MGGGGSAGGWEKGAGQVELGGTGVDCRQKRDMKGWERRGVGKKEKRTEEWRVAAFGEGVGRDWHGLPENHVERRA